MTKEDFIARFKDRSPNLCWAFSGDAEVEEPSAARIARGWAVEKPSHKLFNWLFRRIDRRILELEARVAWLEEQLADGGRS